MKITIITIYVDAKLTSWHKLNKSVYNYIFSSGDITSKNQRYIFA